MASSTNKRGGGRDGFGRKDMQQPPMLPSDPPGTRRQLPSGLGGQMVDKNWDYISGATTLGGGKYQSHFNCCSESQLQFSLRETESLTTKLGYNKKYK